MRRSHPTLTDPLFACDLSFLPPSKPHKTASRLSSDTACLLSHLTSSFLQILRWNLNQTTTYRYVSFNFTINFVLARCEWIPFSVEACESLLTVNGGRGGRGGGFNPPTSRTLESRSPPCICWLPPLCIFSIAKYCAMLHNFSLFLPLPATLGIPLPAPSSPASRTPPANFSPGLPPPCPLPLNGGHEGFVRAAFDKDV